jgi:hypothetical protein
MIGQNCCLTLHPPTNWKRAELKPSVTWTPAPNTKQPFNPETATVGAKFPNLSSSPPAQRTVQFFSYSPCLLETFILIGSAELNCITQCVPTFMLVPKSSKAKIYYNLFYYLPITQKKIIGICINSKYALIFFTEI